MAKVKLTSNEFLSLYTGILLGDDVSVVESAMKKVYGINPYDYCKTQEEADDLTLQFQENFKKHVDKNYKNLAGVVEKMGEFKPKSEDLNKIIEEVHDYVKGFEENIGSKEVVVDQIPLNAQKQTQTEVEEPEAKSKAKEQEMVK